MPAADTEPNQDNLTPCKLCGQGIAKGARLCHFCKSFQKNWRNWVPHVGAGLALVTFIWSVLGEPIQRLWHGTSLMVLELKVPETVTVLNDGARDVLIEHLEAQAAYRQVSIFRQINRVIKPGEVARIDLGEQASGAVVLSTRPIPPGAVPVFYFRDSLELQMMRRNLGNDLLTFPGDLKVVYRPLHGVESEPITAEVTGVLVVP